MGLRPHRDDDIFWCTADCGWVTGHSYVVYGPLSAGAAMLMYEGAPNCARRGPLLGDHREVQGHDLLHGAHGHPVVHQVGRPHVEKHDLSSLRLLGTVGEGINPEAWMWYHRKIGGERCPIVDTWWQTETGGIMMSPGSGSPVSWSGRRKPAQPGGRSADFSE
jgi:acetyl-CoA synthetase